MSESFDDIQYLAQILYLNGSHLNLLRERIPQLIEDVVTQ